MQYIFLFYVSGFERRFVYYMNLYSLWQALLPKKRATTLKKNTRKPTHFDFMNTHTVQQAICYAFYNI